MKTRPFKLDMLGFGNFKRQIQGDRLILCGLGLLGAGTALVAGGYVCKAKHNVWHIAISQEKKDWMYGVYQNSLDDVTSVK